MYSRLSKNDRRRFQRLEVNLVVLYRVDQPLTVRMQVGDKEIEATTLNLSEGGMAILTDYDIPAWTVLAIKLTLSRIDKEGMVSFYGPMEITGEVRSNVLLENSKHRLGLCFAQTDIQAKREITNFLQEVMRT